MEKYGVMPGTQEVSKSNPTVRSKFDKSQGKGLPAPHLKHPGETAKETGTKMPGHNENGHKMPVERSVGLGGSHLHHSFTPGEMGAPMLHGQGMGMAKNTRLTDGNVVKSSSRKDQGSFMAGGENRPSGRDGDKHAKQHPTGHVNNKMGGGTDKLKSASHPQHQDKGARANREGAGVLSGGKLR